MNDNNWIKQYGKNVILMEPDEPWYISLNNKKRKPIGALKKKHVKLNEVGYKNHADYKSNFVMDTTKPDMGYGYSYASRLGEPYLYKKNCGNKIETFDTYSLSIALKKKFNSKPKKIHIYVISLFLFLMSLVHHSLRKS